MFKVVGAMFKVVGDIQKYICEIKNVALILMTLISCLKYCRVDHDILWKRNEDTFIGLSQVMKNENRHTKSWILTYFWKCHKKSWFFRYNFFWHRKIKDKYFTQLSPFFLARCARYSIHGFKFQISTWFSNLLEKL